MFNNNLTYRFLFAGGGTGGHLYPAIAVAQKIKELQPDAEILFIGTKTKIEAKVVPALGFNFKPIWISGFSRKFKIDNLLFPLKLLVSVLQSLIINFKFKPQVAIGTGAYVSGPAIFGATVMGAKGVLLEQNSFPGITNRLLEKRVKKIFLSFEESKRFFKDQNKLEVVGNPVRTDIILSDKIEAKQNFGLNAEKKVIVIVGGSLGARTINEAIKKNIDKLLNMNLQILWQTGERYYENYLPCQSQDVRVVRYFEDISKAYSAADLLITRAGATTIAELAQLGLPVIFVPSPNVAANHQYKNAEVLRKANAAELIKDLDLTALLPKKINELITDDTKLKALGANIKNFARPDAANKIASELIKMASTI